MKRLADVAQSVLFRAGVAFLCLVVHLTAITHFAAIHFGLPFDNARGQPPTHEVTSTGAGPTHWNRLVVSRWDTGQYVGMTLDHVYGQCPKADLRTADLRELTGCDFTVFPGFPLLGWVASLGGRFPADYSLLGVALVSSFLFLFLWTGPTIVSALGIWGAYCSLLLLNVFTTGFTLVTALSDPTTMLCVFAAYLCLEKRYFLLGAFLSGAASGLRVTGLSAPVAFACGLLVWAWDQDHLSPKEWIRTAVAVPLSAWGTIAMMVYQWCKYDDPLIYLHAHSQGFGHNPKLWHIVRPEAAWIVKSMASGVHEVAVLAIVVLWFALGHREGLGGFSKRGQVFWYVQFLVVIVISSYGTAEIGYTGMTRYTLLAFGAFFAMAGVLKNKPLALGTWCLISGWHYWHSDLCYFEQQSQPVGMGQCLVDVRDNPSPSSGVFLRLRGMSSP
jgi:hypothetical protein